MDQAELRRNLTSWIIQLGGVIVEQNANGGNDQRPELPIRDDDPPAMAWLRKYVDEARESFQLLVTVRPGSFRSVSELPIDGVTHFQTAHAALTVMLRLLTGGAHQPYDLLTPLRALITYLLPKVKATGPTEPLAVLRDLQANPNVWSAYGTASYIPTPQILRGAIRMIKASGWTP